MTAQPGSESRPAQTGTLSRALKAGAVTLVLATVLISLASAALLGTVNSSVGFGDAAVQFAAGAALPALALTAAVITHHTPLRLSTFFRLVTGLLSYFGWVLITGVLYTGYQGGTQLPNLPLFGTVNILLSVLPFIALRPYPKQNGADFHTPTTSPLSSQDVPS